MEPYISTVHFDYSERGWAARAGRHAECDPLSWIDLGSRVLAALPILTASVVGRQSADAVDSPAVSALQGFASPGRCVVWRRHSGRCCPKVHGGSRL